MRTIHKALVTVATVGAIATGGTVSATAAMSQAQTTSDRSAAAAVKNWGCEKGSICFYTGANGTGEVCWRGDSFKDWDTARCRNARFLSVFNNGHAGYKSDARAYQNPNHQDPSINVLNGQRLNFGAPTPYRSVQWH